MLIINQNYNMRKGVQLNSKKSPHKPIDVAIDEIIEHHYFVQKVNELVTNRAEQYLNTNSTFGQDKYLVQESEITQEIGDILCLTIQENLRKVLNEEFMDVTKEVDDLKNEMYLFMEEQTKLTTSMKKQLGKGLEEIRRKTTTEGIMGNIVPARGNSVRLMRTNLKSSMQETEKKSQYTEMMQMKKEISTLKFQIEKGDKYMALSQQLNDFKIQTKVSIEGLKLQMKKNLTDSSTSSNKSISTTQKQTMMDLVKKGIKSQLGVFGSYGEQVSHIKAGLQKMEESIEKLQKTQQQYFSNQLKSVWLVINDIKKNVDFILEHEGLHSSELI